MEQVIKLDIIKNTPYKIVVGRELILGRRGPKISLIARNG